MVPPNRVARIYSLIYTVAIVILTLKAFTVENPEDSAVLCALYGEISPAARGM